MREIKFRAWDIFDKVMVYCNEHNGNDIWDGVRCSSVQLVNDRFEEYRYKWLQFTGLYDKHQKPIYEGDIVSYFGLKYEVLFKNGAFGWMEDGVFYSFNEMARSEFNKFEIIGNVYENPELLEG